VSDHALNLAKAADDFLMFSSQRNRLALLNVVEEYRASDEFEIDSERQRAAEAGFQGLSK
jgi:hypothetical protein